MSPITGNIPRRAPRGARTFTLAVSSGLIAAALSGCATSPPPAVPGTVEVCSADQCGKAAERYSAEQLAQGLGHLLQMNDGAPLKLCGADPKTRECLDDDIGYFVLGGILPGRGSARSATMSQVQVDADARAVRYVMAMPMRFLGIDLSCADHDAVLTVQSPDAIQIVDSTYRCTWMVMGIMGASFSFAIDSIDFDKGRVGGRWKHSVAGTGNGRGQGYAVIEFPKALARDEQSVALK
jgi:hypothetical protein